MNTLNALGFLLLGVLMKILPSIEPAHFKHLGPDGTSAAAIWFIDMGLITAAVGGIYLFAHHVWPSLKRAAAYRPAFRGRMTPQRVSR